MKQLGAFVLNIVTETSFHASVQVPQALLEVRLEPAVIQHVSNVNPDDGDNWSSLILEEVVKDGYGCSIQFSGDTTFSSTIFFQSTQWKRAEQLLSSGKRGSKDKPFTLLPLHLPVLDCSPRQVLVKLHRLEISFSSGLILLPAQCER